MENEKIIHKLNELVEINNDRIEGYERASKESEDSDLVELFKNMAAHSRDFKSELSKEILQLGGKPTEGTKNSGKIFRIWMDVKVALTVKDRHAVISSCEFGEDAALETYEEVLKSDNHFSPALKELVMKQQSLLRQDHDEIKRLRELVKS